MPSVGQHGSDDAVDGLDSRPAKRLKAASGVPMVDSQGTNTAQSLTIPVSNRACSSENAGSGQPNEETPQDNPPRATTQIAHSDAELCLDLRPSATLVRHNTSVENGTPHETTDRIRDCVPIQNDQCQRDDIGACLGARDPNEEQTTHLLSCYQCWSKVSSEVCSQRWLNTSLHLAIRIAQTSVVEHLISCGANPAIPIIMKSSVSGYPTNQFSECSEQARALKMTALHSAIREACTGSNTDHSVNIVRLLSKKLSILNRPAFPTGTTPINMACQFDRSLTWFPAIDQRIDRCSSVILTLLEAGADANIPDAFDWLPIHSFIRSSGSGVANNFSKIFEKLMSQTADLTLEINNGDRALDIAARYCHRAVEPLLARGVSPKLKNKAGMVPLHHVTMVEAFRPLVNAWPEALQSRSSGCGLTPLHIAVIRGLEPVVKAIIEYSPVSVKQLTNEGQNCLHLTRLCKNEEKSLSIINYLLAKGCNPEQKDAYEKTVLHYHIPSLITEHDVKLRLEMPDHHTTLSRETKRIRLRKLLSNRIPASEPNREGQTLLGSVLIEIFNLAEDMKKNNKSSQSIDSAAEALMDFFLSVNNIHDWIQCAGDLIRQQGDITEEERIKFLDKKSLRADQFAGPFLRVLGKGTFQSNAIYY